MTKGERWWGGAPPTDDLKSIQDYLRGGAPEEILESLGPRTADTFYMETETPLSPPTGPSIFEEIGVGKDEFVELALQQPEVWEDGELDDIMDSFVGEGSPERLEHLAREFFTGYRTAPPPAPPTPPKIPTVDEIKEDLGLEDEDIDLSPLPGSISDMETSDDTVDVGDWWINKDKKS